MKKYVLSIILPCLLVSQACSKSGWGHSSLQPSGNEVPHEMIVLGEQLDDPYSVSNVTKALASLYPTKAGSVPLTATDWYVRLLPRDDADLEAIRAQGVHFLDHPLDYRIVQEGDYYEDPALPEGSITWQYAVVPTDYQAPDGVRCELLHECYLVESENGTKSGPDWVDWEAVEREAFRLSGNADMLDDSTKGGSSRTPMGRITILDPDYDSEAVGVAGVTVSCNVFVKFARAYTDEEGYYEMKKSFSSAPRYRLVFSNQKGFNIGINAIFVKASISTLGKHESSGCSVCISSESDRKLFVRSVVNNATYDFYNACSSNGVKIKTPPAGLRIWLFSFLEGSVTPMTHQGAILDIDAVQEIFGLYTPVVQIFMPDIIIGYKNKPSYRSIYHVVQHELAHSIHYMQVGSKFWDTFAFNMLRGYLSSGGITYGSGAEENAGYCEVSEMWAYYLENVLYRQRYRSWDSTFGSQYWFHPEIFLYLDSRGMNYFKIFPVLTSDIHDRESLKARLISYYPEFKSTINEAFNKYL